MPGPEVQNLCCDLAPSTFHASFQSVMKMRIILILVLSAAQIESISRIESLYR